MRNMKEKKLNKLNCNFAFTRTRALCANTFFKPTNGFLWHLFYCILLVALKFQIFSFVIEVTFTGNTHKNIILCDSWSIILTDHFPSYFRV